MHFNYPMSEQILDQDRILEQDGFTLKEQIIMDPLPHFMPMWSARVLDGEEGEDIRYTDSGRCLVGEAHGMSDAYSNNKDERLIKRILNRHHVCDYCNRMSFNNPNKGELTAMEAQYDKKKFIQFKKNMYEHMQKHHKKEFKKLWLQT